MPRKNGRAGLLAERNRTARDRLSRGGCAHERHQPGRADGVNRLVVHQTPVAVGGDAQKGEPEQAFSPSRSAGCRIPTSRKRGQNEHVEDVV